jgi:hypothetical protein
MYVLLEEPFSAIRPNSWRFSFSVTSTKTRTKAISLSLLYCLLSALFTYSHDLDEKQPGQYTPTGLLHRIHTLYIHRSTNMPRLNLNLPTMLLQPFKGPKICEQDDASTSSTLTVERLNSKQQQQQAPAPTRPSRSVRFCLSKNESFSNEIICKEDLKEMWYAPADYKHFRVATMYVAKEITKAEARNKAPFSYERVMTHTYLQCCRATSDDAIVLTALDFKHLVRWAEVATTRLGLEKWSIRSVGHDRSFRRALMVDLVLESQNNYQDDFVAMDDYVGDSLARISRPMRLFSRTLAEAQAVAGQNDLS